MINHCIWIIANTQEPKEKKPRWNEPQEIIKVVADAKVKFNECDSGVSFNRKDFEKYVKRKYANFYTWK